MDILISLSYENTPLEKLFDETEMRRALRDTDDYKSRYRLINLTPKQFIELAKPLENTAVYSDGRKQLISDILDNGTKLETLLTLRTQRISDNVFQVVGHDGRHRSLVLEAKYPGKAVPVYISDSSVRWLEDGYKGKTIVLVSENKQKRIKVTL